MANFNVSIDGDGDPPPHPRVTLGAPPRQEECGGEWWSRAPLTAAIFSGRVRRMRVGAAAER